MCERTNDSSISVLPREVIEQTGSATLQDALRTVPGITFGAAEGGNPVGDRPFIEWLLMNVAAVQDSTSSDSVQPAAVDRRNQLTNGLSDHQLPMDTPHSPTTQSLNAFTNGVCARASG